MPQRVVQAVLFDLDGTLVDSAASVERNWRKLADRLGRPFADVEPFIHGMPGRQALRLIEPDLADDELDELSAFMVEAESTDTGDVLPLPGAARALDQLSSTRWAVVTSGGRRLARARLSAAGLPLPRHLVTADDVAVGKPDPAPYLLGARLVGHPPGRCLAVEDAPAGVTSAGAAGVPVLGLRTTHRTLSAPAVVRDLAAVEFSGDRLGVVVSW